MLFVVVAALGAANALPTQMPRPAAPASAPATPQQRDSVDKWAKVFAVVCYALCAVGLVLCVCAALFS